MRITEGHASAPGKAVLAGEYAVLHGAPALAMAINRRAHARLRIVDGSDSELSMPGLVDGTFRFRHDGAGNIKWLDSAPRDDAFALFECAWQFAPAITPAAVQVSLDSREFFDSASNRKLGLGSSAALMVALCALLQPANRVATSAADAHRLFQDGAGSGVDIAAAVHGGLIEFSASEPPQVQHRQWPDGLHLQFFWSGVAVSTPVRIRQLDKQLLDPARLSSLATLSTAASELAVCWPTANAAAVQQQFLNYNAALLAFDQDQGLGIYQGGHDKMRSAAESIGLVYKPCGAGGGDIGVALGIDADALERFVDQAKQIGFTALNAGLDQSGVDCNGRQV